MTTSSPRLALIIACLAGIGGAARADPDPEPPSPLAPSPPAPSPPAAAADTGPTCAAPASDRPPDPRCGESLDGRSELKPGITAPQAALLLPREASKVLFWPIVEGAELLEVHHVPNWVEAIFTSDDGLVGFRPELYYSTSFISTIGGRVFFRRFPGRGAEVALRALTGGSSVVYGQLQLRGPDWSGLALDATFDRRHDRLFAGIGANSSAALTAAGLGLARFGSDILRVDLRWSRRIERRLLGYAYGDVQRRQYEADQVRGGSPVTTFYGLPPADCAAAGSSAPCVSEAYMPGFEQGLRIAHLGGGVTLDARRHARDGSGVAVTLDGSVGRGVAGDPTEDGRVSAEALAAIGGTDKQLLLRGRGAMVSTLNGAPIPFDELVSPSGRLGMRGFPDGRFRGESGVVASAEYRYYIASTMDASVFTDLGTVAGPAFSGLFHDHWFPDVGIGLRLYPQAVPHWEALARGGLEIAYAPDGGLRFIFALASF